MVAVGFLVLMSRVFVCGRIFFVPLAVDFGLDLQSSGGSAL